MKIISVIPARYQSSSFYGKPLQDICCSPMGGGLAGDGVEGEMTKIPPLGGGKDVNLIDCLVCCFSSAGAIIFYRR